MGRFTVAALALIALAGCANLASISSGQIGCPVSDITVINDSPGLNSRTWTALCNGKVYFCSGVPAGQNGMSVSCKEREDHGAPSSASVPAQAQQGGCQFDTQCKSDRVCQAGQCVEARPRAVSDGGAP
jgi:hypothetical protein